MRLEILRFNEEIAFIGVADGWSHRVINEMVRLWTDVEGIVNLLSDEQNEGNTVDQSGLLSRWQ